MDTPPPPPPEPAVDPVDGVRVRRAIALIAVSLVVIGGVAVGYLHPSLPFGGAPGQMVLPASVATSNYQLTAMDFVNPTTGWVVALFDDGDFLVMRTTDGGQRWTPELSGPTNGAGTFMRFFDTSDGVFALTNTRPLLYRTTDGGVTWISQAALNARTSVLSWSFVDPANGWMLVRKDPHQVVTDLYRTSDAGGSWTDLGSPLAPPDQAYEADFALGGTGWLVSLSAGPYAYRSDDYGSAWSRVPLPNPPGGWARGGQFLVSAQPTGMTSVVLSAVTFPPPAGRSGVGATILGYPPLQVRAFDGGGAVTYTYSIESDSVRFGPSDLAAADTLQVEAPDQRQLVSLDGGATWRSISLPSSPGAIGFFDSWHWWWIGSGSWSMTADAGETWTDPRNLAVAEPLPGSLQVLDSMHARFVTMAGSRPVLVSTDDGGVVWRSLFLPPMSGRFTP